MKANQVSEHFAFMIEMIFYENSMLEHIRHYILKDDWDNTDAFQLQHVDESEVLNTIQAMSLNKASGLDFISAKFAKSVSQYVLKPLNKVINLPFYRPWTST